MDGEMEAENGSFYVFEQVRAIVHFRYDYNHLPKEAENENMKF